MRLASGTGAATTRSLRSMMARRSRRWASGSPTPTGRRSWNALVNPLLPAITAACFPGYWWVIDQCEYASDILFTAALEAIRDDLVTAPITALGATDVLHFLERKPHPAF